MCHIGATVETGTITSVGILADLLASHGPIKTARVSSAQARGAAKKYSYWGAVRYEVRLTASGEPTNVALERASSDRRSETLVERDCDALCEREDRVRLQRIGRVSESDAARLVALLADESKEVANA